MNHIEKAVKWAINSAGFDICRLGVNSRADYQLLKGLKRFDIDLILDVGANAGQFALNLRSIGFKGRLVSFEPLSSAHLELKKTAGRDFNWIVHPRCAIGAFDGESEINVAGNSVSSSILPMMDSHTSASANSAYVGTEKVPIFRLGTAAPPYMEEAHKPFLKIDAQGYEWQVLDGASAILPRISGVLCELSLVPLYKGQRLWLELTRRLEDEGFTLWSIDRGFTDSRNGRALQVDAAFFRM